MLGGFPLMSAQAPAANDAVPVSFLATGRDGRPVTDLKADEVELRLDGRMRTLESLQRIGTPGDIAGTPAPPPPFGTNVGSAAINASRTTFLVIDDSTFRPGNEGLMKRAIEEFLAILPPTDRVALMTTPLASVRTEVTTPTEVRQALERVTGNEPRVQTPEETACRTRETLESMRGLLSSLAGATTSPTVIFFSTGLSATIRTTGKLGTSQCDLSTDSFRDVGTAAAEGRVHVYVVQADLNIAPRNEGLDNLAGVTGAPVMTLAGASDNPLKRIALETSSSYLASFMPEPSERNGQPHRLELRVTRPDVTVRATPQLPLARPLPRTARKTPGNPREMLREATIYRDVPLRVAAFPSREGDKIKLVAIGELVEPSTKLAAAVIGVYDLKGKLIAQSTATPDSLGASPLTFAVPLAPGRYRLRLAVTDTSGRGGTADYDVNADLLTVGALKLSALVLGSDSAGFKPTLEFASEPSAIATFELYGKPPAQLPLKLDIAATADGPPLLQVQPSGAGTKDPDRFIISGVFPLATLAPGDYVVRATVGTPESGEGRLTRTLRKTK